MSDVRCPYCGEMQEINHDDGYGYDEGETHEQECPSCEYEFNFTTAISYDYEVFCREGDHELEPFGDPHPNHGQFYTCNKCDYSAYIKVAEPESSNG